MTEGVSFPRTADANTDDALARIENVLTDLYAVRRALKLAQLPLPVHFIEDAIISISRATLAIR